MVCFETSWRGSFQDFLALNRLAGKTTRRWYALLLRGIALLVAGVELVIFAQALAKGRLELLLLVVGILLLLIGGFYHYMNAWKTQRMMARDSDNVHYRFDEDGIRTATAMARTEHTYSAVWAIYRFRERIFIFVDKRHCYIVPEQGFTQGRAEELIPFLEAKCGMEVKTIR